MDIARDPLKGMSAKIAKKNKKTNLYLKRNFSTIFATLSLVFNLFVNMGINQACKPNCFDISNSEKAPVPNKLNTRVEIWVPASSFKSENRKVS